tara:strand:+ start:1826 stop:2431 length:606 start_codon:yes stop_codon:yes gene_type:complete
MPGLNTIENEMLKAIQNNDYDTVERLLLEGVNPNKKFTKYYDETSNTSCFLVEALKHIDLSIAELLLKYGANPTMYLYTNVVSGRPFGNGIYRVTPYGYTTSDEEEELLDYYIHIRNLQRRIRNKKTLRRRKKMKSQQLLALSKAEDRISNMIGNDLDENIYSNISNHLSNMRHMPSVMYRTNRESETHNPYLEWMQDYSY